MYFQLVMSLLKVNGNKGSTRLSMLRTIRTSLCLNMYVLNSNVLINNDIIWFGLLQRRQPQPQRSHSQQQVGDNFYQPFATFITTTY